MSVMYDYVRARQLEGTYSDDPSVGCRIITSLRIRRGWGMPDESDWPYDGSAASWPPKEPLNIDEIAKADRILCYQRVRTLDECKMALAQEVPVQVALTIVAEDWRAAPNGQIPMPRAGVTSTQGHAVCLVGYDDHSQSLRFVNSWGTDWGDAGYGSISYSYFVRNVSEAWTIGACGATRSEWKRSGLVEQTWGIRDYFADTPLHGMELFDAHQNECVGWAFVLERQGFADIEELFVRPSYRAKGYGRHLAQLIRHNPNFQGRSLRLWVSHADVQSFGQPQFSAVLQVLGLTARRTQRRWAVYVAM